MKSLITLIVLGMLSGIVVGCRASGEVGDNDHDRVEKKTTTTYDNGDRTVKTQTTVEKQ